MKRVVQTMGEYEICNKHDWQDALEARVVVVANFYTSWVLQCKMLRSRMEEFSNIYRTVLFIKIDNDTQKELAAEFDIQTVPTTLFFQDGKKVDQIVGGKGKEIEDRIVRLREAASAGQSLV